MPHPCAQPSGNGQTPDPSAARTLLPSRLRLRITLLGFPAHSTTTPSWHELCVEAHASTPNEPAHTHVAAEGPLCYLWVQAGRTQLTTATWAWAGSSVAAEGPLCYLWVQAGRTQLTTAPRKRVATASHNLIKGWHPVEAVNRKLIRPSLNEVKEQIAPPRRAP